MTIAVYASGMHIDDDGNLVIDDDEMDAAGVKSVELVEVEGEASKAICDKCFHVLQYEDQLPETITDAEYDEWYAQSWIQDGVRVGPHIDKAPKGSPLTLRIFRARIAELEAHIATATKAIHTRDEALAAVAELEAQLKAAQETIAHLRNLAYERQPKIAAEEANRQKAELEAQLAEACKKIEHQRYWYGCRSQRLQQFAKEEMTKAQQKRFFSIMANGTADSTEPPTYAQQYNMLKHRAEEAEARLKDTEDKLNTEMAEHTREVLRHVVTKSRAEKAEKLAREIRRIHGEAMVRVCGRAEKAEADAKGARAEVDRRRADVEAIVEEVNKYKSATWATMRTTLGAAAQRISLGIAEALQARWKEDEAALSPAEQAAREGGTGVGSIELLEARLKYYEAGRDELRKSTIEQCAKVAAKYFDSGEIVDEIRALATEQADDEKGNK